MANFIRGGTRIYDTAPAAPPPRPQAPWLRELEPNNFELRKEGDNTGKDRDDVQPAHTGPAEGSAKQPAKGDNYLSALLKLVPAEIVTIYLAAKDPASAHNGLTLWFSLCLLTCIIFRAYSNLPDKPDATRKDVQWRAVGVSALAFVLWAFATAEPGKPPIAGVNFEPWLAGAAASLFGILAPLVVPADPQTNPPQTKPG